MTNEQFASEFKELTDGIPDEEVAKFLQISKPTVQRWRDGETRPHPIGQEVAIRACSRKWGSV
jgi:DNA-binding transcriptional regulator YiaG